MLWRQQSGDAIKGNGIAYEKGDLIAYYACVRPDMASLVIAN